MSPPQPIKRKKVLAALKKIEDEGGVYLYHGGKHLKVVAINDGIGSFPVPVSHPEVSCLILKSLIRWMELNNIKGAEHIKRIIRR